jgi:beta-glucosidase
VERLGRLLAGEARRKGVDVLLAPTVNLHRSPYGGRHFECFSEDPLLTARIGVAYVRGLQAGGVAATVKHFVANDSETERLTLDARVDVEVEIAVPARALAHWDGESRAWTVEQGRFHLEVGRSYGDQRLATDVLAPRSPTSSQVATKHRD